LIKLNRSHPLPQHIRTACKVWKQAVFRLRT
jgi:hypothetical protein